MPEVGIQGYLHHHRQFGYNSVIQYTLTAMISEEFLQILRCPISRGSLMLADEGLLARLNQTIQGGQIRNHAGESVDQVLEGGLVDEASAWLYPISNGIPCLLAEEAIALAQLAGRATEES